MKTNKKKRKKTDKQNCKSGADIIEIQQNFDMRKFNNIVGTAIKKASLKKNIASSQKIQMKIIAFLWK